MRHTRYCLAHHPDISSNITNATHFSTPATPAKLVHNHFSQDGTTPMSPTVARHPSMPPT